MPNDTPSFRHSPAGLTIGELLARVIVPLWVAAGAIAKLATRDPRLLPEPIIDWVGLAAVGFMEERNQAWLLDTTLRTLIGIELVLVVAMICAPRIARMTAAFTLSIFLVILALVMAKDFSTGGISLMLTGSCGCLGSWSPPPWMMFLIDAALLGGIIAFPMRATAIPSGPRVVPILLTGGAIVAFSLAFLTPPKSIRIILPPDIEHSSDIDDETIVSDATRDSAAPAADRWPTPPEVAPMYFPQVGSWVGRHISEIDLLQQMRPAPPRELLSGVSYIVIYRGDCQNCHDLLELYMSDQRAERTIALRIAEGDPAADKPMPSDRFRMRALPEGPTYVVTTPVLAVLRDGVVEAASAGVDIESADAMLTSVETAVPVAPPAAAAPSPPSSAMTPAPGAPAAPPTSAPERGAARPWPTRPVVDDMYFPQFEQWIGERFDRQPLALQIQRPMPVNQGRWYVLFYRADCEHCHHMMDIYLVGDAEPMVIAVQIPDTDPANDLGMPLTNALLRMLPQGPTYVIQTPVLLTVQDGVVLAMATDPDDHERVMATLTVEP